MITMSPMLACRGFDPGPGLSALIIGTLILWLAGVLAVIPNILMSCRDGRGANFNTRNLVFAAIYVILGGLLFSGVLFDGDNLFGFIFIFIVPAMSVGHFIYLYVGWRRDRKAKKQEAMKSQATEAKGDGASPTAQKVS
jgi:hypothetical protein